MSLIINILSIIFLTALAGVVHTYLFYPLLMHFFGLFKRTHKAKPSEALEYTVEIIFAAYNEDAVIEEKLLTSFQSGYPKHLLSVRIGSDASTDKTDAVIRRFQEKESRLFFTRFDHRTGKAEIINELARQSEADLIIFTDANILFQPETVEHLVRKMHDRKVGICGGKLVYRHPGGKGISQQENAYLRLENSLKSVESKLFGCAMGAEGGCYIIRTSLFPGIPENFYMEDFYITMHALSLGFKVVIADEAEVFEDVSVDSAEEYKRKVRISIGNFQNLKAYRALLINKFWPVGWVFLSHKVLRWITPILLIIMLLTVVILAPTHPIFALFAGAYMAFIGLGLFGILFAQKAKVGWLKYPGHFIHMNLALLEGLFIFTKGVNSNVWQPTKRNQD